MTSQYAVKAGAKNIRPDTEISQDLKSITRTGEWIAEMRQEENQLNEQITKQREWLCNGQNKHDPKYAQRQEIHESRNRQLYELQERMANLLEQLWWIPNRYEGEQKHQVLDAILKWDEPPF